MPPEPEAIAAALDEEGYLVDPDAWTEAIARALAAREGIELTPDHWEVVRFMRAFYEERRIAPDARHVLKHLAQSRGADRNALFRLFPYGYVKQACKMAGMRKPRVWSTGASRPVITLTPQAAAQIHASAHQSGIECPVPARRRAPHRQARDRIRDGLRRQGRGRRRVRFRGRHAPRRLRLLGAPRRREARLRGDQPRRAPLHLHQSQRPRPQVSQAGRVAIGAGLPGAPSA